MAGESTGMLAIAAGNTSVGRHGLNATRRDDLHRSGRPPLHFLLVTIGLCPGVPYRGAQRPNYNTSKIRPEHDEHLNRKCDAPGCRPFATDRTKCFTWPTVRSTRRRPCSVRQCCGVRCKACTLPLRRSFSSATRFRCTSGRTARTSRSGRSVRARNRQVCGCGCGHDVKQGFGTAHSADVLVERVESGAGGAPAAGRTRTHVSRPVRLRKSRCSSRAGTAMVRPVR